MKKLAIFSLLGIASCGFAGSYYSQGSQNYMDGSGYYQNSSPSYGSGYYQNSYPSYGSGYYQNSSPSYGSGYYDSGYAPSYQSGGYSQSGYSQDSSYYPQSSNVPVRVSQPTRYPQMQGERSELYSPNQTPSYQSSYNQNARMNDGYQAQYNQNSQMRTNNGYQSSSYGQMRQADMGQQTKMIDKKNDYSEEDLKKSEAKYPQDSSMSAEDRQINAKIRNKISSWFSKGYDAVIFRTANGIVVISGTVESNDASKDLEDKVKGVEGVRSVNNQASVKNAEGGYDSRDKNQK